jgi:hypothetical protein
MRAEAISDGRVVFGRSLVAERNGHRLASLPRVDSRNLATRLRTREGTLASRHSTCTRDKFVVARRTGDPVKTIRQARARHAEPDYQTPSLALRITYTSLNAN